MAVTSYEKSIVKPESDTVLFCYWYSVIHCHCIVLLCSLRKQFALAVNPDDLDLETGATLALTCDDDTGTGSTGQSTNWLQLKKALKERNSTRPTHTDHLLAELDAYLAEPNIDENVNPLGWWSSNQFKYSAVAIVARSFLGIPATSVASERVFSKCGRICTERRSVLSAQHVQQLVFLGQNLADPI